jgi:biopolymer transport protein ExbD
MDAGADDGEQRAITGINVTPLVDVTLVLLIVFIVTAKTITSYGLPVDVPRVAGPSVVQATLVVAIDVGGTISLDGRRVDDPDELRRAAAAARARDPNVKAVIRASRSTTHGAVVTAMDALRRADVRVAFAVDRSDLR